jgi:hypothetical protein
MIDTYHQIAARIGSHDALELAAELKVWHDAMVKHRRQVALDGDVDQAAEDDECPHTQAPALWKRAQLIFGEHADGLALLREIAEQPTRG